MRQTRPTICAMQTGSRRRRLSERPSFSDIFSSSEGSEWSRRATGRQQSQAPTRAASQSSESDTRNPSGPFNHIIGFSERAASPLIRDDSQKIHEEAEAISVLQANEEDNINRLARSECSVCIGAGLGNR